VIRPFISLTLGGLAIVLYAYFWMALVPAHGAECQTVTASFYGLETCHPGKKCQTANGEHFDGRSLTAAMPSRKYLGRHYSVSYEGKSVVVRINDVGPAKWTGRGIDLSRAAAARLGMIEAGTARVCLTRL
jgi:rare lipoprotein A